MQSMLHIGVSKEAVKAAQVVILAIIDSKNNDAVKIAALETLRNMCNTDNTTVSHCNFQAGRLK
jgi:hypothetical protein